MGQDWVDPSAEAETAHSEVPPSSPPSSVSEVAPAPVGPPDRLAATEPAPAALPSERPDPPVRTDPEPPAADPTSEPVHTTADPRPEPADITADPTLEPVHTTADPTLEPTDSATDPEPPHDTADPTPESAVGPAKAPRRRRGSSTAPRPPRRRAKPAVRSTDQGAVRTIKESLCLQAEQGAIIWTRQQGLTEWERLMAEWKLAGRGEASQDEVLWRRFRAARDVFFGRIALEQSRRRAGAAEAEQKKRQLCQQIEAAAQLDDPRQAASQAADLMAQWKLAGRASPRAETELWERFRTTQAQIFERLTTHRQSTERARQTTVQTQRDLIAQARSLIGSPDRGQARARMTRIIEDFRAAGFGGRELNLKFQQVRDEFFSWLKAEPAQRRPAGPAPASPPRARPINDIAQLEAEIARVEAALAAADPGPRRRHGHAVSLSLGAQDQHSQLSAELMRLRLRRDQLSRRPSGGPARLAPSQSEPEPNPAASAGTSPLEPPEPEPVAPKGPTTEPKPTEPEPTEPKPTEPVAPDPAEPEQPTTGPEPAPSTGLEVDAQLQHGGEPSLGVVQVETADLTDPTQPVTQSVGMDEEAG
jgi:hypothetical protein